MSDQKLRRQTLEEFEQELMQKGRDFRVEMEQFIAANPDTEFAQEMKKKYFS